MVLVFDLVDGASEDFSVINEGGFWSVGDVGPGLRVLKPADAGLFDSSFREPGYTRGGVQSRFTVEGDFAVTVDFWLFDFPQPTTSSLTESILVLQR